MNAAEKLLAIEEIKQLKARYFRYMDTKDWAGLREVFCDDATFDARASLAVDGSGTDDTWVQRGGDAIAEFIRLTAGPLQTVHHGHAHEIEILSDKEARGVIAMEDQIWEGDGKTLRLHGCGHYHETYRRETGGWRILSLRLTRLHVRLG